jgi:glycosyltransferase involved in cell wall biosynthesis
VYVGSFAVYQGIDLMFNSMPEVIRKQANARFVIIGGTPEKIAARKEWLKAQGIESSVLFTGKIPPDELPHHLAAADILLSPRIAGKNTPLKLLDYLKAGGAIVATDNEANRGIVDDTSAMLVEPIPAAFAEAICRMIRDPAMRTRLAEKGRLLIRKTYNYEEFKRRLRVCYEQLGA